MSEAVIFKRLRPSDLFEIERQASQALPLGAQEIDSDVAEVLAAQPVAWSAWHGARLVATFGIGEHYAGVHGVAWSILDTMGAAHLAVTRCARAALMSCGLNRVELIARAAPTPFHLRGDGADLRWAMDAKRVTPECRWARLLGFTPAHVLHGYGPKCETHMLFEWFGSAPWGRQAHG